MYAYARLPDEEDVMDDAKERQHNEAAWIYACKMWVANICMLVSCLSPPLPPSALGGWDFQTLFSCAANLWVNNHSIFFSRVGVAPSSHLSTPPLYICVALAQVHHCWPEPHASKRRRKNSLGLWL